MAKRLLLKKNNEIVENLSREIPENGIISVGSDNSAVLCLDDELIAPEQFIIIAEEGRLTLLNRAGGTFFNGTPLAPGALQEINIRDEIRAGQFSMIPESKNGVVPLTEAPEFFSVPQISAQPKDTFENHPEDNPDLHITMNDVLENLRSDEKFYFLIEDEVFGKKRVYVEFEEMWIGWTADNNCVISENPADIQTPRAQIRKDWSGVVLFPNIPQTVQVNEEILSEPYRLKNDDHLFLQPVEETAAWPVSIKFHEPTALLVLDSILPKELPPPVSIPRQGKKRRRPADTIKAGGQAQSLAVKAPPPLVPVAATGRIFGYFTFIEIVIMAAGTLIAAAMIFLVLELF